MALLHPRLRNRGDNNPALPQAQEPARISTLPIRRYSAAYYRSRDPIHILKEMKGKKIKDKEAMPDGLSTSAKTSVQNDLFWVFSLNVITST